MLLLGGKHYLLIRMIHRDLPGRTLFFSDFLSSSTSLGCWPQELLTFQFNFLPMVYCLIKYLPFQSLLGMFHCSFLPSCVCSESSLEKQNQGYRWVLEVSCPHHHYDLCFIFSHEYITDIRSDVLAFLMSITIPKNLCKALHVYCLSDTSLPVLSFSSRDVQWQVFLNVSQHLLLLGLSQEMRTKSVVCIRKLIIQNVPN